MNSGAALCARGAVCGYDAMLRAPQLKLGSWSTLFWAGSYGSSSGPNDRSARSSLYPHVQIKGIKREHVMRHASLKQTPTRQSRTDKWDSRKKVNMGHKK